MTEMTCLDGPFGKWHGIDSEVTTSSAFPGRALMHEERMERPANGVRLSRIEGRFKAAFETAERVPRLRVFLADDIERQLLILNELHAQRLLRERAA